jgi:hypothetical protein
LANFRPVSRQQKSTDGLTGLPDDTFAYQKSKFGYILEGFGLENFGILWPFELFYDHLVYVCISCPFGTLYGPSVYFVAIWFIFFRFGTLNGDKSGNPGLPETVIVESGLHESHTRKAASSHSTTSEF